ncbi:MAG: Polysaccharide biosynthesis protein [Candidatus Magasanikbacteria bacterium GW2011_GWC2_40_17]|uniref:Polysaccharide biosynthesis protein n=1 Tax=Candidatus Magasanikbacteria bacterium GW2011_GWA2_42_32 TaxID=1619039 RepID=A0A0G1A8P0_9BACT|nr:MAG: Polysaccharide biosynthesis protein [Candidatus Magasanikbacteria bacterium GW2011_GWC2_40_17]KKS57407.1 MAG: Polysaccharide biosynthesis protein [Candidatus Magasanikbacteria bacterium GW2011_GWA2_42_32]
MSLARKISQNTAIVYSQTLVTLVFGAASAFLIIRNLERYQFGLFSLAMSAVWMIIPWIDFGIGQVVSADVAGLLGLGDLPKVKRLLFGFYKTKLFLTFFATVGAVFVSYFFPDKFDQHFIFLFRVGSVIILTTSLLSMMLMTFESHSKFLFNSLAQIIESVLRFVFVLVLVVIFKMGSDGAMLSYIASTGLAALIMLPLFFKMLASLKGVVASPEPMFKNLIRSHGKFQIFSQPLKSIADNLQIWIIGWLAGINAVAIYQVAIQIYNYIAMFASAAEGVLMPILSQELNRSREMGKFIIVRMSKYSFWFSSAIMVTAYLFVPWFITLLFGHKYDASILLFYIIFLALPLAGLSVPLRPAFFAAKGQKQLLKIHFLVTIILYPLAAILTFFLRDINGALGFAIIFPLAAFLSFILRVIAIRKFFGDLIFQLNVFFIFDKYDRDLMKRIWGVLKEKFLFFKL